MLDTGWFFLASFIGKSDCSTGCMKNHMVNYYYKACTEDERHKMHTGTFTEICSSGKLPFLETKTSWPCRSKQFISLCDINFQHRCCKAVGKKKKKITHYYIHPVTHESIVEVQGKGGSVHAPQFVHQYLKKKGWAWVGLKPTGYIVNWQCLYFYDCSE